MKKFNNRKEAWFRIVVGFVSGIILVLWRYVIYFLILANFLVTIFEGKRNKQIALFCEYWNGEAYRFLRYMTFVSNKRPFPFSDLNKPGKIE